MPISSAEFLAMQSRLARGTPPPNVTEGATREIEELHEPFIDYCRSRGYGYIRSRSDQASTIGEGINDFTVFAEGHVILIEFKTKTGKLSVAQSKWVALMQKNKFPVSVCRTLEEGIEAVESCLRNTLPPVR